MQESNTTELTPQPLESFTLRPSTLKEAMEYSQMICESSFCPKDFKGKPGDVLVAVQMGGEIGLQPMQAIQNIAVINGRPCVWGDALPALAKAHPLFEYINESFDDENMIATCKIKRRNEPEQMIQFSKADAELAKLWNKTSPWQQYPKRMLAMRARGWAIRNAFPDALKGVSVAEEVRDYQMKDMGNADVSVGDGVVAEPEQSIMYPDADFNKNLKTWLSYIESGNKTANDIIATVESKGALTDKQKDQIRGKS